MKEIVKAALRDKVFALEAALFADPNTPDINELCPVKHHFSPGVYAREMFIPKGVVVVGKIHKHTQLSILSRGDLSLVTDSGVVRVGAGFHYVAPPGTKRAVYAHEDSVWTTILHTDLTDVDEIERFFVVNTEAEYLAYREALLLEKQKEDEGTKCLSEQ